MAVRAGALNGDESAAIAEAASRAAARFPWYADTLARAGFLDQPAFERIPVLGESDLAATYYAADEAAAAGELVYMTSGTSTGKPKKVRWPAGDHERYLGQRAKVIGEFIGATCRTACGDLGTGHAAAAALEVFARLGLHGSRIDVSWPVERHVEILAAQRPDFLLTMPMILEHIVAAGGPGYVPKRIAVLGDLAPLEWRAAIAFRIGMDPAHILDLFGSIEVGAIACSNDAIGGNVFHEHILPEVMDPRDGRPADTGPLLLTSLERDGFPAIRYASGDIVAGLGRIDLGGRTAWSYRHHLGRTGDELKHGEMLSLHTVSVAMARLAPGVTWNIRRSGLEVVLGIEGSAFSAELADSVRFAIRAAHPAVDRMIDSGLIGDIRIEPWLVGGRPIKRLAAALPQQGLGAD